MLEPSEEEDSDSFEIIGADEEHPSVAWQAVSTFGEYAAYCAKWSAIYTVGTVAGCYTTLAIAPRLAPIVISYVAPTAAESSIMVATAAASVGAVGYGAARTVSTRGAEVVWDATSMVISSVANKALTYLYNANPPPKPKDVDELCIKEPLLKYHQG